MSGVTHLKKLFVVWLELKLSFHVVGIGAPEALLDSIIDFQDAKHGKILLTQNVSSSWCPEITAVY